MYSLLLKKTLPFALAFIIGSLVAGLFGYFGAGLPRFERRAGHYHRHYHGCAEGRGSARTLVAESTPLAITFKPDAQYKLMSQEPYRYVRVSVTFGADGKVQRVDQLQSLLPDEVLKAAESAARQIQFVPETVNGVPVTVTREVEIRFETVFG